MATDRQLQESVARCVATMVLYHNEARTRQTSAAMKAEVQSIAATLSGLGLPPARSVEHILSPVKLELLARYGPGVGTTLYKDFVKAFEASCPILDPVLTPSKL